MTKTTFRFQSRGLVINQHPYPICNVGGNIDWPQERIDMTSDINFRFFVGNIKNLIDYTKILQNACFKVLLMIVNDES